MTEAVINSLPINHRKNGTNAMDINSGLLIKRVAEFFKENDLIKIPNWAYFVKCSHGNELPSLEQIGFLLKQLLSAEDYIYQQRQS